MMRMARIDRVSVEARKLQFGRAFLNIVVVPFYGLGWTVGKLLWMLWKMSAWMLAAVKVGWQDART
jgi:hypothetical protein